MNRRSFVAAILALPSIVRGLLKPAAAKTPNVQTPDKAARPEHVYGLSYAHPNGEEYDHVTFLPWTPPKPGSKS
jgi:hypothetical protein